MCQDNNAKALCGTSVEDYVSIRPTRLAHTHLHICGATDVRIMMRLRESGATLSTIHREHGAASDWFQVVRRECGFSDEQLPPELRDMLVRALHDRACYLLTAASSKAPPDLNTPQAIADWMYDNNLLHDFRLGELSITDPRSRFEYDPIDQENAGFLDDHLPVPDRESLRQTLFQHCRQFYQAGLQATIQRQNCLTRAKEVFVQSGSPRGKPDSAYAKGADQYILRGWETYVERTEQLYRLERRITQILAAIDASGVEELEEPEEPEEPIQRTKAKRTKQAEELV